MNTYPVERPEISISAEHFALGTITFYMLNFGALALVLTATPFMLIIGGVVLQDIGIVQVDQTAAPINHIGLAAVTVVTCLLALAIVGLFFYWGTKSIVRGKPVRAVIFFIVVIILHMLWFRLMLPAKWQTINWFELAMVGCLTPVLAIRWKRLFP